MPVDWEALEDAFENNAPEVHSYLHLTTGEVLRVVDGVADPQMHVRIASDGNYLRIDPVSSREQYRWMERFIPMVDDAELRGKLTPGHRRQGRVPPVQGRADVVRAPSASAGSPSAASGCAPSWRRGSRAHAIKAVAAARVGRRAARAPESEVAPDSVPRSAPKSQSGRRTRNAEALRQQLKELAEALGPRDLDMIVGFAEFLKARRAARGFAHHHEHMVQERAGAGPPLVLEEGRRTTRADVRVAAPSAAPSSASACVVRRCWARARRSSRRSRRPCTLVDRPRRRDGSSPPRRGARTHPRFVSSERSRSRPDSRPWPQAPRPRSDGYQERDVRNALEHDIAEQMLASLAAQARRRLAGRQAPAARTRSTRVRAGASRRRCSSASGGRARVDEAAQRRAARRGRGRRAAPPGGARRLVPRPRRHPLLHPSDEQLREVYRTSAHPYRGQPYEQVRDALARWFVVERLRVAEAAFLQAARSRVRVTVTR